MKNTIKKLEEKMWEAAKKGDEAIFLQIVSTDAVMVCGGYRCTGAEYAGFVENFGIAGFEISNFEIVHEDDKTVQVHYIVRTTADSDVNADIAGLFNVTSTWAEINGVWKLVFNMDSRIMETV